MIRRIIAAFVFAAAWLAVSSASIAAPLPAITPTELACSGIVSPTAPRADGYVITGQDASDTLQFLQGDLVYLHIESGVNAETGEQFLVVRATKDPMPISWFHGQKKLEKRMGRLWEDVGRVRVVRTGKAVATARIESSCAPMDRGDFLVPFRKRVAPPLRTTASNETSRRASHGPTGRVVMAKKFRQLLASGSIAYVNLGAREGIRPGDRLSLFRYPGSKDLNVDRTPGIAMGVKGFGHAPVGSSPARLPRETLGGAIVLRVSPTAATILITESRREIALGDYAQIE